MSADHSVSQLPASTMLTLHKPAFNPLLTAVLLAAAYLSLCVLYIWISTAWAARLAHSKEELAAFEQTKGTLFVLFSATLIGGMAYWMLRSIAHHQRTLQRQNIAMIDMESRAMAGVFAAGIAHDIKNMMMPMQVLAWKMSKEEALPEHLKQHIEQMKDCVERTNRLTRRLMKGGREVSGTWEPVSIEEVVRQTVQYARLHPKVMKCRIEVQSTFDGRSQVNAQLIHQMLLNLIINAADATRRKGTIRVALDRKDNLLLLSVADDGPGVPPEKRDAVFTPFFSTKTDGTGLGLISVKTCAEMHGGEVVIDKSDLGGALFEVRIPVLARSEVPAEAES